MVTLTELGFDEFFSAQVGHPDSPSRVPARVASAHRDRYEVWGRDFEGGALLSAKLRGATDEGAHVAVGDWVTIALPAAGGSDAVIETVLSRRTAFVRGAAGKQSRAQVVAANVDVTFVVCGLDDDYNLRRIERYLARIYASGAMPVVLLNKADLCDDTAERVLEVQGCCIGVPVYAVSAATREGVSLIMSHIDAGATGAFVGSSGVGKSSLINALIGDDAMATAPVRRRDGRGVHTTTCRQLIRLPDGGFIIDTPGMRELQLVDDDGLDEVFSEIEALAAACRFRDCRHDTEPGCAVKAAVADGTLDEERLAHFHKLAKEARANAVRMNDHARKQSEKVWGQLYKEGARIRKWKEGE